MHVCMGNTCAYVCMSANVCVIVDSEHVRYYNSALQSTVNSKLLHSNAYFTRKYTHTSCAAVSFVVFWSTRSGHQVSYKRAPSKLFFTTFVCPKAFFACKFSNTTIHACMCMC